MKTRVAMTAMWSDRLESEIKARSQEPYTAMFGMGGDDYQSFQRAVNQGIDSHLEAVMLEQDGRRFTISPDTLHVLVRRLMEDDDERSWSLASDICETLDIELI